ncbi:CidA/LrgA family protein [Sulfurimonas sp. HSL3-7]|uniref:CidA/LrgA family protein n=1 Tax=Sulfonitrofixus jiaomeiensis TaxID=3131938 RepID=UPI0031F96DE2
MKKQPESGWMMLLTIVKELAIILAIYALAEALSHLLDTRFPGSVIGMLLLLAALHLKWIKVDDIRYVSSFLLGYMPLFFIPAGVGVMASYTLMEGFYLPVIVLTLVSTVIVMAVTGRLVQRLVQREKA